MSDKSTALLDFLGDAATLRRKRVSEYTSGDQVFWFGDLPAEQKECRSPILTPDAPGTPDSWLVVAKKQPPARDPLPTLLDDWIRPEDLNRLDQTPEPLNEITVLVEYEVAADDWHAAQPQLILEERPEVRRLSEQPEIQDAWLEYLVNAWEPWAEKMRRWQVVQGIYERIDLMRRRLEESEERFELILAVGLLQWRDAAQATVKRHLLTAPAEIELEAAQGILTVVPAASFDGLRVELDMLELHDQPRLQDGELDDLLEDVDIEVWNRTKVEGILNLLANRTKASAEVYTQELKPRAHADEIPRVVYAPALVLRERRPTAYEELIKDFSKQIQEIGGSGPVTPPWEKFISEGGTAGAGGGPGHDAGDEVNAEGPAPPAMRLLFPLATNAEQRQIVERLHRKPYVVVKGPPGTGKSQTIANLISHLLAQGERVLVTAHAPKALAVLRELLPKDIRDLCVTALGSSREDHRYLKDSVEHILRRHDERQSEDWPEEKREELERQLQKVSEELVEVERMLRENREAETHSHVLSGGYEGTTAVIARRLEAERAELGWLPAALPEKSDFPLQAADIKILAEVHSLLTPERIKELALNVGSFALPAVDEFKKLVDDYRRAAQIAKAAREIADPAQLASQGVYGKDALTRSHNTLQSLETHASQAESALGTRTASILHDLLAGAIDHWKKLQVEVSKALANARETLEALGTTHVEILSEVRWESLGPDVQRRISYFRSGGKRRRFLVFTPRLLRETQHVESQLLVDGRPPRDVESLEKISSFLSAKSHVAAVLDAWPESISSADGDPRKALRTAFEVLEALDKLLHLVTHLGPEDLRAIPVSDRASLSAREARELWLRAIDAQLAALNEEVCGAPLKEYLRQILDVAQSDGAHPCMTLLAHALKRGDPDGWRQRIDARSRFQIEQDRHREYDAAVDLLDSVCPGLGRILRDSQGDESWKARLLALEKAWQWSCASAWVQRVSSSSAHQRLIESAHQLQAKIEKRTEQLAIFCAWNQFFGRLDEFTTQNLKAWIRAIEHVGRGTGQYAYRHRRSARKYLMACIPNMPAWVMPLHRLWDTVKAQAGLFDTVIIDEASQAGAEALLLLLLAKRVIVVGDDKQNSPEAVGIREDDIARLTRQHLGDYHFRDLFRPDVSLFDHSERAFGNIISLREHFRCVPEIIRFSNDLCYQSAPLIPLRQAPPNRLAPLKRVHVVGGACEGEGQRIINRAEAERIVETILSCVADSEYDGKTMGVIVLQGHSQAELIASMLAARLNPEAIERRKIRCGVPATFQGDQRDVIYLSLVASPDHRHRALGSLADTRRFNVAMSRARDQVWLFHSIKQHDLSPQCLRRQLLSYFENPHPAAQQRIIDWENLERQARTTRREMGSQPDPFDSWFEVDVALEIMRKGYAIRPQYEAAGKYIDLMIEGDDSRLAVECDGDFWHGPEKYAEDMARQRQLERVGQVFVRVRESQFYANRLVAIQEVIEECKRLGIEPLSAGGGTDETPAAEVRDGTIPEADNGGNGEEHDLEDDGDQESDDRTGPFAGYSEELNFPDPRDASIQNVSPALRQIIEKDGPLTRGSVLRLYIAGCPHLQRAGKTVQGALNRTLGAMIRSGEIVQEDELGDRNTRRHVVRLAGAPRVRQRPRGGRDLEEIPPSELALVVQTLNLAASHREADSGELHRPIMAHYGFNRLTASRRTYLEKVIVLARQAAGCNRLSGT